MKYRDLITLFLAILLFLSLAYTIGVNFSIWPITIIIFIVMIFFVYKLWIE